MSFKLNFNAAEVAPAIGFEAMPSGIYDAAITKSEGVANKTTPGAMRGELTFTILTGAHKGRTIVEGFNLTHPNEEAIRISNSQLSAIGYSTGVMFRQGMDTAELHGRPLKIQVSKEPRSDLPKPGPGEEQLYSNRITAYRDSAGNKPGVAPSAPAASAGQSPFTAQPAQQFAAQVAAPAQQFAAQVAAPAQQFAAQAAAPVQQFAPQVAAAPAEQFVPQQAAAPVQQFAPVAQFSADVNAQVAQQAAAAPAPVANVPDWAK